MRSIDAQESRPQLHDPESGFGLTHENLGGPTRWSSEMLGEERYKQIRDESIGIYTAEGYKYKDPDTGEVFIAERVDGAGKRLTMNDILPGSGLGGALEIEIIVRARELPEEDEARVDVSNEAPSIPLWTSRS